MGHLDEIYYLGAIAIGGMIFNFLYWGFGFLRMGTTGLTAQAYGEESAELTILNLIRPLIVAFLIGVVLILFQNVIANISFYLVETTPAVEFHARNYFDIRIWAAPATLILYVFNGWFLGMQNARFPMFLAFLINSLNIGFNLLFVKYYAMNATGVAWGTLLAQYGGLLFAITLFLLTYTHLKQDLQFSGILRWSELKRFFNVNRDIFIRTLCLMITLTFFTAESSRLGESTLAINTILLQFWMLMAYGVDGFAFAAESLVGKYTGAKDLSGLRKLVQLLFYWGLGLATVFSLVYMLFFPELFLIFTDKHELLIQALPFYFWIVSGPLTNTPCFLWDGIYIGATASKAMRNSMIISTFVVFFPIYYLFKSTLGNHALWLAMMLFMICRGITLGWGAKKYVFLSSSA